MQTSKFILVYGIAFSGVMIAGAWLIDPQTFGQWAMLFGATQLLASVATAMVFWRTDESS